MFREIRDREVEKRKTRRREKSISIFFSELLSLKLYKEAMLIFLCLKEIMFSFDLHMGYGGRHLFRNLKFLSLAERKIYRTSREDMGQMPKKSEFSRVRRRNGVGREA
jgi:hypothetical protein